jgi:hypothetical protein
MRDDVWKLPLPAMAKRYARRKGLKSMMRQPKDFLKVNAMIINKGKDEGFKNRDAVGPVKLTFEAKKRLAIKLLEKMLMLEGCHQCNCNHACDSSKRCPKCGHYHKKD